MATQSTSTWIPSLPTTACSCSRIQLLDTNIWNRIFRSGGRGDHQGGGAGIGGVGTAGHAQQMSPELQAAVENAKQDRIELQNAPPELKAQCQEACNNSQAEVLRLGGRGCNGRIGEVRRYVRPAGFEMLASRFPDLQNRICEQRATTN